MLSTTTEPPQELIRKLGIAEDLAARLQKKDWQTRGNRDKLESLIKETLEMVRRTQLYARLRRIDALLKAQEELERIHDLGTRDARQGLEVIFYQLRVARQGR